MLSLSSLLTDPNPDDPLRSDAAKMYKDNYEEFVKLAKEVTLKHANATDKLKC